MLHFFHVFSTFDAGGLEVRAIQLMELLGDRARHTVVSLDGKVGALSRLSPRVRLELALPPRGKGPVRTAFTTADHVQRHAPDLVLTYNWGSIEAVLGASLTRFPRVIHHEDGFGPEESLAPLRRRVWLRRALLPTVRALVVPSRQLERLAVSVWHQPEARVRYLPNGVDLERFRPRRDPRGGGPVLIGHIGRFRPEKNQSRLIQAFADARLLGRAELVFIGDGPLLPDAKALAAKLGVATGVRFLGNIPDPARAYRELDLVALSSTTEQMPLSVLEGMATGLPIVSLAVGDVESMVSSANQQLIVPLPPGPALGQMLTRVVDDPELRARVGKDNRAHAERTYALEACLSRHMRLYLDVAARPGLNAARLGL